jgi:multisubunit Na+/H+ antiporter MnhB subunit
MTDLSGPVVLVTWPQLLVGGGGIAVVAVGVIFGVVVFRHVQWRREPPIAIAYAVVMVLGAVVGGACFIVAASLRSHFWEVTGSIIIVASYIAREVLARLLRRRYPDED